MYRIALSVFALCLVIAACTESDTGGDPGNPGVPDGGVGFTDSGTPPDATPDTGVPPQGGEKLDFFLLQGDDGQPCKGTTRCVVFMSFNAERTVNLVATRNGQAAPELQIVWEITKNKNDSLQLGAKTSFTANDGSTSNSVKQIAQQEAQYEVKASINGSDASPVYFDIVVTSKGQVPLIVSYTYTGVRDFQAVTTYLFKHEAGKPAPTCAGMDPAALPTADLSSPPKGLTQSAAFPNLPGLTEEGTQTYTVVGIGKDQDGPPLVFGCDDSKAVVSATGSKSVVVPLQDLPPAWKGKYDVVTQVDLISLLPENVAENVNIVLDFFKDPPGQVLVLVCKLGGNTSPFDTLCGAIFVNPANPCIETTCFEPLGIAVKGILEQVLSEALEGTVGGDIFSTGEDIANILTELELGATFEFLNEPAADNTYTVDDTHAEWHSVTYRWTLGSNCDPADTECGKRTFSINAFQGNTVEATFAGHVEYPTGVQPGQNLPDGYLFIDKHALGIHYGALLLYIIEKELLPLIVGDANGIKVDNLEAFLKTLLGGKECLSWEINPNIDKTCCGEFAVQVGGTTTGSVTESLLKAVCTAGIPLLTSELTGLLTDLDLDTTDNFTLETAEACDCFDADANMSIDAWGSLESPCLWTMSLTVDGGTNTIDNHFRAVEQQ